MKDTLSTLNDYDIIFVGCPVWWFDAPMIIHSFLECKDYNFAGKTIVPFCTYATASYETLNDIINATPDSEHLDGLGTRGSQSSYTQVVSNWLDSIGISDIVSGIEGVSVGQQATANENIYSINGVKVNNLATVPKGIYIQGGKKIVSGN